MYDVLGKLEGAHHCFYFQKRAQAGTLAVSFYCHQATATSAAVSHLDSIPDDIIANSFKC